MGPVTWMCEVGGLQGTATNLRVQVPQKTYQPPWLQTIVAMQKLCCHLSTGFYLCAETSQILSSMKMLQFSLLHIFALLLKKKFLIEDYFRSSLGSQQNGEEGTKTSHISIASTHAYLFY